MYGPYVKDANGRAVQTRLIAFIDDASRVLCHGQFFAAENTDSLITTLRAAFYNRGIPEQIYVNHGGIYTSKEMTLICARLGCILRHAPLRDGASKGKIERFFRTVREQFLAGNLDLSSLETLNKLFTLWVEDEYNSKTHSAIGMKQVDRFAIDLKRIRFLPPSEITDELFYDEDTRMVKKDNTFPFKNKRYEVPADLRGKQVSIRFDRFRPNRIVVYHKGQRIGEARELDLAQTASCAGRATSAFPACWRRSGTGKKPLISQLSTASLSSRIGGRIMKSNFTELTRPMYAAGKYTNSIKRLLLKIARFIGRDCYRYVSFLLETGSLSNIELEILERIFTMGLYSDEVIDAACFTAIDQNVTGIVDFNFLVSEVDNSFHEIP
ncbi:MAG: DDE-type integrase/transposase/recombinase [Spirochaetales bacterium]|nr:DDE-type integrase/transposase/recombinase [Spirochaetales bacterium]